MTNISKITLISFPGFHCDAEHTLAGMLVVKVRLEIHGATGKSGVARSCELRSPNADRGNLSSDRSSCATRCRW
jgi:hypothetical protein